MMTRKDYQAFAKLLKQEVAPTTRSESEYRLLVEKFATTFEMQNENFDREKFIEACEVDAGWDQI